VFPLSALMLLAGDMNDIQSVKKLCHSFPKILFQMGRELIDCIKVLRPTQHKIGDFGDVPQHNLLAWGGETKPNTTRARIHQAKQMYYNTK